MLVNELHQGGIRALLDYDNTIFDNFHLPEALDTEGTLDLIVDTILFKYGDTPLFSPDPDVVKFYIGRWSTRRAPLWDRYYAAITEEYDPLENYNRIEHSEFTHGKKVSYSGTVTDTPSGSIKIERDDTNTGDFSADNSTTYVPDRKDVLDGETVTSYENYQEQRSYNNSDTNSGIDKNDSTIHGNVGVTTSQQMLQSELDLIPRLDLIDYIADDWHSEFCLQMYV